MVTLEQGFEGGEEMNPVEIWWKSSPGRGKGKCKGPEAGVVERQETGARVG